MRILFAKFFVTLLLSSISILAYSQIKTLDDFKWKNRVVLLFAPSRSNANLVAQQAIIKDDKTGYTDRDLVVLSYLIDDDKGQAIKEKFRVNKNLFTFILVGKDGGQKLIKHEVVKSKDLFDLIDSMPMRRSEMRRKNE